MVDPAAGVYAQMLRELYSLEGRGIRPGLERIQAVLAELGNPHRTLRVVHVAGTNGKGSVCRMVHAALESPSAGLYTSPHLHRLSERVELGNGVSSTPFLTNAWGRLGRLLARQSSPRLTFFEAITVLAFCAFRDAGADPVVIETGLGGRLDATNVFERPLLTALTQIGLDHQSYLGPAVSDIAREKIGIARSGVPLFVAPQTRQPVEHLLRALATDRGARPIQVAFDSPPSANAHSYRVEVEGRTLRLPSRAQPLRIPLEGAHQAANTALAAAIVDRLASEGERVDWNRLERARCPGRLETIQQAPGWLLDGAHNPDACRALAQYVQHDDYVLLFAAMADKDHPPMLQALTPAARDVVLTRAPVSRSADPRALAALVPRPCTIADSIADAMGAAADLGQRHGARVVVAGSLHFVAAIRAELLGVATDPPIAM